MNPRIEKINAEIKKHQDRIAESTAKVKELERQRTEIENTDIIGVVRAIDATPEELLVLLKKLNGKGDATDE